MSEIKTIYTKEQIAEYLKESNLDVLNSFQIWVKLMEMESRLYILESFIFTTRLP